MSLKINGNKTYMIGAAVLGYLIVSFATGAEVSEEVIYTLLAAMGITVRHGVSKTDDKVEKVADATGVDVKAEKKPGI